MRHNGILEIFNELENLTSFQLLASNSANNKTQYLGGLLHNLTGSQMGVMTIAEALFGMVAFLVFVTFGPNLAQTTSALDRLSQSLIYAYFANTIIFLFSIIISETTVTVVQRLRFYSIYQVSATLGYTICGFHSFVRAPMGIGDEACQGIIAILCGITHAIHAILLAF